MFCGSTAKKTREHIWGDWLKAYVRRDLKKHGILLHDIDHPADEPRVSQRIRAGDPLNVKAKIVCANCNSTWLSDIQNSTKPYLIPLIRGEKTFLGPEAQEKIATWITMATMTSEYLTYRPREISITQGQRMAFMNTPRLLDGWKIWIGVWVPHRLVQQWVHASLAIYDPKDLADVEHFDGAPQTNTQTTTVRIGKFFFHAMSSSDRRNVAIWDWRDDLRAKHLLVPIWPIRDQFIVWPVPDLTDGDAYRIARAFIERVNDIAAALGR